MCFSFQTEDGWSLGRENPGLDVPTEVQPSAICGGEWSGERARRESGVRRRMTWSPLSFPRYYVAGDWLRKRCVES